MKTSLTVFWFRRDLRLTDNHGLYKALQSKLPVLPIFIFDETILSALENKEDARVGFLYNEIQELKKKLQDQNRDLYLYYGKPETIWAALLNEFDIQAVYANEDYEPYALKRDEHIRFMLQEKGASFHLIKDQVIFGPGEVLSESGTPYRVYTPFKNKWLSQVKPEHFKAFPSEKHLHHIIEGKQGQSPSLTSMGFKLNTQILIPSKQITQELIKQYEAKRNFPYEAAGTSRFGIHLRFGTISIREKAAKAGPLSAVWLSELIWREFFMHLLFYFPESVSQPFQPKFHKVTWRNDEADFERWKQGTTGYPIVDAGIRELLQTGHMHNRVRMVVASFLCKHLFLPWQWGERFFAQHLLDFELSANVGNWQWCAGTGADAQPYFRIFNPVSQQEKFDPQFAYIKQWVPEWGTPEYPKPMVEHKSAVDRAKRGFEILKA
jgi:deoxyribodipyrimidine photo-lyase